MRPFEPDKMGNISSLMSREEGVQVMNPRVLHNIIRERPKQPALTEEEVKEIKYGDKRIYVFGKITYDDVFGNPHHTEFCHMYFGQEMAPFETGLGYATFQAKYCDTHNDAD